MELELDALPEQATAGVGDLAPRAQGQREVGAVDEVVAIDPVLEGLRAAYDEEVLGMVHMNREVARAQLERGVERVRDFIRGDREPGAGDGGNHPTP